PGCCFHAFRTCADDTQCGCAAGSGCCLGLPWFSADGTVVSLPLGTSTTFTVNAAGAYPTCEHQICVPCGDPNHTPCAGIPACEVAGNPQGCITRATQGCCDQPGYVSAPIYVGILAGLCARVSQIDCGTGVVNTSNPQTGRNQVRKVGDTSD